MDNLEDKYMSIKALIKANQEKTKNYRKILNETAEKLMGQNETYEFSKHDIIITRPSTHKSKKRDTA